MKKKINLKKMKVVILAGGFGTRLSEYTKDIPKPMVKIDGKPIIFHIMSCYAKYGFKNFYIALGYKGKIIKKYFKKSFFDWNINLIDTGKKTMTGGRLKRLKKYLKDQAFLMTYGDGISDINIRKLVNFHKKNKKLVTLTAVRPPARFGAIKISGNTVRSFKEKSKLDEGWINGGFFILNKQVKEYIDNDNQAFEKEPLTKLSNKRELAAFKHHGLFRPVDTIRELEILESELRENEFNFTNE